MPKQQSLIVLLTPSPAHHQNLLDRLQKTVCLYFVVVSTTEPQQQPSLALLLFVYHCVAISFQRRYPFQSIPVHSIVSWAVFFFASLRIQCARGGCHVALRLRACRIPERGHGRRLFHAGKLRNGASCSSLSRRSDDKNSSTPVPTVRPQLLQSISMTFIAKYNCNVSLPSCHCHMFRHLINQDLLGHNVM